MSKAAQKQQILKSVTSVDRPYIFFSFSFFFNFSPLLMHLKIKRAT